MYHVHDGFSDQVDESTLYTTRCNTDMQIPNPPKSLQYPPSLRRSKILFPSKITCVDCFVYFFFKQQKVDAKHVELINTVRTLVLENKTTIETNANPQVDAWINDVNSYIDEQAADYVAQDEFLNDVPPVLVNDLKSELEPIVRNDYVNQKKKLLIVSLLPPSQKRVFFYIEVYEIFSLQLTYRQNKNS